jgi:hypothetical protein
MGASVRVPAADWREDAAVWEIVAGELFVRRDERKPGGSNRTLLTQAREMAERAAEAAREDDLNAAGHALIGTTTRLGLTAIRVEANTASEIADFAAELGAMLSWDAGSQPSPAELEKLAHDIAAATPRAQGAPKGPGPTLWELAVRAGGFAGGLSPHIARRSERRDLAA